MLTDNKGTCALARGRVRSGVLDKVSMTDLLSVHPPTADLFRVGRQMHTGLKVREEVVAISEETAGVV